MGRSRMFEGDEPRDNESPRTTIVGGRPPEKGGAQKPVPTGMESLLRLAAVDPSFRGQLLERRGEVAEAAGVALTESERAILAAIPAGQLEAMASQMPSPPPQRRDFLRQTAASAVVLLGGVALASCDSVPGATRGIRSDMPPARVDAAAAPPPDPVPADPPPARPPAESPPTITGEMADPPERARPPGDSPRTIGGEVADPPPARPDHPPMQPLGGARPERRPTDISGGAAPDTPPARPTRPPVHTRGGAAPHMPDHRKK